MKKVLITAEIHPYIQQRFEALDYSVDVIAEISSEKLASIIHDYSIIIITTYTILNKEILEKAEQLKLIGRVGSGMENVDVEYCRERNIICINSPEGNANAVGEHCLALLLNLLNNVSKSNNELKEGLFLREENRGEELDGKTIGIIGYGHTGGAFARKLQGFDVRILAFDKYKKAEDNFVENVFLKELQEQCDIISFHVPYNKETHHYCDQNFIMSCKKRPYIINTSRGGIINTKDIVAALEIQELRGLCIDVFEDEPLDKNKIHPYKLYKELINFPNVIATPHIAGWTVQSKLKLAKILMEKIEKVISH